MRVAYIAPYQGPELLKRRPILRNLGLAANVKMELIGQLLQRHGHQVEVLSQGEVVERKLQFYPAFRETETSGPQVPVFYTSALPVRFLNGMWSSLHLLRLFKARHRASRYDVVMIYNLKQPQVIGARHATRRLGLPVILEYEDDAFVDIQGRAEGGFRNRWFLRAAQQVIQSASAGLGASPHLLSKLPASLPKLLLRGVVDEDVVAASARPMSQRKNWVVYSGGHFAWKGLEPLVRGWKMAGLRGWELHIAGRGELTATLERMAADAPDIVFHGLLNRRENAQFLAEAKIGINPHDISNTPGNVFAFKIIEYLCAGLHCATTPMGTLEPELEDGITYLPDNAPETIAAALKRIIAEGRHERLAFQAAHERYGPEAVGRSLDGLLRGVKEGKPGTLVSA